MGGPILRAPGDRAGRSSRTLCFTERTGGRSRALCIWVGVGVGAATGAANKEAGGLFHLQALGPCLPIEP